MLGNYAAKTMPKVLCCECSIPMEYNPSGMCENCLQSNVDISEGITKMIILNKCRGCSRYLSASSTWQECKLESRELLSVCLKKVNGLKGIRLVDAGFIWTEPHSKKLKVKITIQKESESGAKLEQVVVINYDEVNQTCDICTKNVSNMTWIALVQLRQKVLHKRTFMMIEQVILKHGAHRHATSILTCPDGLDFYFASRSHARTFIDFVESIAPTYVKFSRQLVSHDSHSNSFNYKYTFLATVVPLCKDDLLVLPQRTASSMGMPMVALVTKIHAVASVLDPFTLKWSEINVEKYLKNPFDPLLTATYLTEFEVMDVHPIRYESSNINYKHNKKFDLAEVEVVRTKDFGEMNAQTFIVKSHLGRVLKCGDTVLGYDLQTCVYNEGNAKPLKGKPLPEIVLVRKTYPRYRKKQGTRNWKLLELEKEAREIRKNEQAKLDRDRELFMRDIEEDEEMRAMVNIYKDDSLIKMKKPKHHKKVTKAKSHKTNKISATEAREVLGMNDDNESDNEAESDVEEDFPEIELSEMMEALSVTAPPPAPSAPVDPDDLPHGVLPETVFKVGNNGGSNATSSFGYTVPKQIKIEDLEDLL